MIRHNNISAAYKITDTCCLFLRISIMPNNKKKAININTVDVTGSFGRYVIFSKKFLAPKSQLILFNVKIKTAERKDKMMKFMTPIRILI